MSGVPAAQQAQRGHYLVRQHDLGGTLIKGVYALAWKEDGRPRPDLVLTMGPARLPLMARAFLPWLLDEEGQPLVLLSAADRDELREALEAAMAEADPGHGAAVTRLCQVVARVLALAPEAEPEPAAGGGGDAT